MGGGVLTLGIAAIPPMCDLICRRGVYYSRMARARPVSPRLCRLVPVGGPHHFRDLDGS